MECKELRRACCFRSVAKKKHACSQRSLVAGVFRWPNTFSVNFSTLNAVSQIIVSDGDDDGSGGRIRNLVVLHSHIPFYRFGLCIPPSERHRPVKGRPPVARLERSSRGNQDRLDRERHKAAELRRLAGKSLGTGQGTQPVVERTALRSCQARHHLSS